MNKANKILKHPTYVRTFHLFNAIFVIFLLFSGFQIFNVHPRLYFGNVGDNNLTPSIALLCDGSPQHHHSWLKIFSYKFDVTNWWGTPTPTGFYGTIPRFYPSWMTLPTQLGDMGTARGLHFLFIFVFTLNFVVYFILSILSGRLRDVILPSFNKAFAKETWRDLCQHLRLKNFKQGITPHNAPLQKITYSFLLLGLIPLLILTGLAMSPTYAAAFPFLPILFCGRQTARTIHFFCANLILVFIAIHLAQCFIVGIKSSLRSIITGKISAQANKQEHEQ